MADLDTTHWAPILDQSDAPLFPGSFSAVSSDPTVAQIVQGTGGVLAVAGRATGTATITATRNSDGATASVDVTVEAVGPGEFTIHLGAAQPNG